MDFVLVSAQKMDAMYYVVVVLSSANDLLCSSFFYSIPVLSAQFRLQKTKDIKQVMAKGRSLRNAMFRVTVLTRRDLGLRFAVVVSNKVSPKAVTRNTVKRRVREAVRLLIPVIDPRYDVVIHASSSSTRASYQDISASLSSLFRQHRLLK
jgi:ribonuclease P protein component